MWEGGEDLRTCRYKGKQEYFLMHSLLCERFSMLRDRREIHEKHLLVRRDWLSSVWFLATHQIVHHPRDRKLWYSKEMRKYQSLQKRHHGMWNSFVWRMTDTTGELRMVTWRCARRLSGHGVMGAAWVARSRECNLVCLLSCVLRIRSARSLQWPWWVRCFN